MSKSYSVTSAGVNPTKDRAYRMRMYYGAMTLRVLCVVSLFWVRGWWVLLVAVAAAVLPWFAVMIANAVAQGGETAPDAPDPLPLEASDATTKRHEAGTTMIVVDVEPTRRHGQRARQGPDPDDTGPSQSSTEEETS